jgi:glycosyltransferase involved in cell wall biosynthesis
MNGGIAQSAQVTVSVIIPTHNRPGFLAGAIASVLRQTFTDYEIIVVDDGSTDNTREVVEGIGSPKVRYVHQKNAGVGAARNNGITLARGRYIAFVDDDDEILPDTLASGVEILEKHPEYAMTYGELGFIDPRGNPARGYATIGVKSGYLFREFVLRSINPPILTWLVRRSVFEEIGGFDSRFVKSEDYDMILRITGRYRLYGIPRVLGLTRVHDDDGQRSNLGTKESVVLHGHAHTDSLDAFFAANPGHDRALVRRRALSLWHNYAAFHLMKIGEVEEARKFARKAIGETPWRPRLWVKLLLLALGTGGQDSAYFRLRRLVKKIVGPKLSVKLHRLFD